MEKEKSAAALAASYNPNSAKDRELRQIEILESCEDLLRRIERNTRPEYSPAVRFEFEIRNTNSGEIRNKDMNLLQGENAAVVIKGIKDAGENEAKIEGDKVSWSVSGDQDLGELQIADDTKSALFVRNGKVGTCSVEMRGDADLGPDEDIIIGTVELVCLPGKAVRFELEAKAVPA